MTTHNSLISTSNASSVEESEYSDLLSKNLIDYSMSVITDRAVPDVRDGLKPVQRRILYCMYKEHNTYDKPYKKTAKISGLVSGNYHPHGTAGIDGAIVTMTQTFKKCVNLVDGQGNFGSVEGDSAAASRYTEVRLEEFTEDVYLDNLKHNTVNYRDTYDGTMQEPEVLPGLIPMVLVTGAEGVAVGVKTSIPTFNVNEIIDANIYYLTHKRIPISKLVELLPAPDFASGGVVCNPEDMSCLYEKGTGTVRVRGTVEYHKGIGRSKDQLVVTSIPYTMIGNGVISFMKSVVDLIESKQLSGVTDVIDQTSFEPRIVLELSKDANVDNIISTLYAKTKLEDNYHVNMLVVHEGKPEVMSLRDVFSTFCDFQKFTYLRKYTHIRSKLRAELDTLNAYVTCNNNVDEVIAIVKSSSTVQDAKDKLCKRFSFTEDQASSVVALRIQRLVNLEVNSINDKIQDVNKQLSICEKVLTSEEDAISVIVKDLKKLKKKYKDKFIRRTKVESIPIATCKDVDVADEPVYVLCDKFGYMHTIDVATYKRNIDNIDTCYKYNVFTYVKQTVRVFGSNGTYCRIKVASIPFGSFKHKGITVDVLTDGRFTSDSNNIVYIDSEQADQNGICVVTSRGLAKSVKPSQLATNRLSSEYITLKDNDFVFAVYPYNAAEYIATRTSSGRVLKTDMASIPFKPKKGAGIKLIDTVSSTVCECEVTDNSSSCQAPGNRGLKCTDEEFKAMI